MGYRKIPVQRHIQAAVITTGSELINPGEKLEGGKIYNSNVFLISSRLEEMGVKILNKMSVVDEEKIMSEEIEKMKDKVDLLILTGEFCGSKRFDRRCLKDFRSRYIVSWCENEARFSNVSGDVRKHGRIGAFWKSICCIGVFGNLFETDFTKIKWM